MPLKRPIQTRFPCAYDCLCLKLATHINSLAHSPKGTPSAHSRLRPVVSTQFQILFHSPRRGSFHLSLTVLLHYRSCRVFSLGGWTPQLPTMLACIVVLRIPEPSFLCSCTGLSPSPAQLPSRFHSNSTALLRSCNPRHRNDGFGLFRFRSPLLAESSLFLVLLRCFSSDGSPPFIGMMRFEPQRVSPFGHLRLLRSYAPHRSFSQHNTPFLGTTCLGIHCVPLFAFRIIIRSNRRSCSRLRYYLRVDYSTVKTHRRSSAASTAALATVETRGLEPLTSSVQTRRSPN